MTSTKNSRTSPAPCRRRPRLGVRGRRSLKKKARALQKRTGRRYQDCIRLIEHRRALPIAQLVAEARAEFQIPDPEPPIYTGHFPFTVLQYAYTNPLQGTFERINARHKEMLRGREEADRKLKEERIRERGYMDVFDRLHFEHLQQREERRKALELAVENSKRRSELSRRRRMGEAAWQQEQIEKARAERVKTIDARRSDFDLIPFLYQCYGMNEAQFDEVLTRIEET